MKDKDIRRLDKLTNLINQKLSEQKVNDMNLESLTESELDRLLEEKLKSVDLSYIERMSIDELDAMIMKHTLDNRLK